MKLSYCISTLNRGELLNNSLYSLSKQKFPLQDFEVIVVDDNSTEDIYGICKNYVGQLNLQYIRLEHNFGWRDCRTALNTALRHAKGEVWAASFSEVILPEYGLDILYSAHFGKYPLLFKYNKVSEGKKCIFLPPIDLKENQFDLEEFKNTEYKKLLKKYQPDLPEEMPNMCGGNFCCMSMKKEEWLDIGGLYEFYSWGSVDIDIEQRRLVRNITDAIANSYDGVCLHQWHPKSAKALIGTSQLEYRPVEEIKLTLPFLSAEHESKIAKEEYFYL